MANYLLEQSRPVGDEFRLTLPKGVIAARLSIKPETFSRIIRNFSEQGILTVRGSRVSIHDRASLARKASVTERPYV